MRTKKGQMGKFDKTGKSGTKSKRKTENIIDI